MLLVRRISWLRIKRDIYIFCKNCIMFNLKFLRKYSKVIFFLYFCQLYHIIPSFCKIKFDSNHRRIFFLSYYIFIFFREKEDSSLFSSSKNNMYFSNIKNKKFELLFIHEKTSKLPKKISMLINQVWLYRRKIIPYRTQKLTKILEKILLSLKYFGKYSKNRYFLSIYLRNLTWYTIFMARFRFSTQKYVRNISILEQTKSR